MSHIIKSQEDITKLKECILLLKKEGMNPDSLNIIINRIMPRDYHGFLVDYKIKEKGLKTAEFIPRYGRVDFSIYKCIDWVNSNTIDLVELYKIGDRETLRSYLSLLLLMHEVEHSYQYLMGKRLIDAPCEIVSEGYRTINNLLIKPNDVLPHPIRDVRRAISLIQYYRKQNFYVLERNAQVEALGGMRQLAYDEGHREMMELFSDMAKSYILMGYEKDNKGSMYHTFKELLMMDYYNRINKKEEIAPSEAIRYGLEIPNEVREEVLRKVKGRTK